jgi:hypothetical protein
MGRTPTGSWASGLKTRAAQNASTLLRPTSFLCNSAEVVVSLPIGPTGIAFRRLDKLLVLYIHVYVPLFNLEHYIPCLVLGKVVEFSSSPRIISEKKISQRNTVCPMDQMLYFLFNGKLTPLT